jgi:hypothetical protein
LAVEKRFAVGTPSVVRQNVVVESIRHQIAPSRHEVFLGLGQVQLVLPFILDINELDDASFALT